MATLQSAITYARAQAQTDSNGLTDTNAIVFANEAMADFRRKLIDGGVDAAQLQEAYTSATANQGTYLYPTSPALFFLKAIELNYSDTTPSNYLPATQIDVSNIPGNKSFSWVRANATKNAPYFDDHGDWFEIFPTPTAADSLTDLIRVIYFVQPTDYTSTSDTIAYPESIDYRVLGWRIAANYYYSLNKFVEGDAFYAKYEERVKQLIEVLSRGAQQPIQAETLTITGWSF